MAKATRLGSDDGLLFALTPLPASPQHEAGLAWANFSLQLAGQPVWVGAPAASEPTPLQWTLVELLHGLARIWPWLLFEEGYPIPVSPEHPGMLLREAESRWEDMPAGLVDNEGDVLYDFRQRHDLSLLLRGIQVPPLWVLREGRECVIWSPDFPAIRLPHHEVMGTLTQLGDWLSGLLDDAEHSRATIAIERWRDRMDGIEDQILTLVTGLDISELSEIADSASNDATHLATFYELNSPVTELFEPSEILMAARMTRGCLSRANQHQLLQEIKAVPRSATPQLDEHSRQASAIVDPSSPPWEQGYALAQWLRTHLSLNVAEPVDPRLILERWQVGMHEFDLDAKIDAAAVWGPLRGPCILINKNSKSRASSSNGYRTALAHEICHLLVDRYRALPVVEVLGGNVSRFAEKRANAFAAELLLPMEQAAAACQVAPDISSAASKLEGHYKVSRELVYHQINNSTFGHQMTDLDRRQLQDWRL